LHCLKTENATAAQYRDRKDDQKDVSLTSTLPCNELSYMSQRIKGMRCISFRGRYLPHNVAHLWLRLFTVIQCLLRGGSRKKLRRGSQVGIKGTY